jgi:hypothetical protein
MNGSGDERIMFLVGKPEGKRPLEECRHRREINIKIDLRNWLQ